MCKSLVCHSWVILHGFDIVYIKVCSPQHGRRVMKHSVLYLFQIECEMMLIYGQMVFANTSRNVSSWNVRSIRQQDVAFLNTQISLVLTITPH